MADDDGPRVGALVAKSLLAGGGTLLALAVPGATPLMLAAAILPDVAQFMTEKVLRGRVEKFFARFTRNESTFDNVEASLQAEISTDPHLAQTIWSAVRAVLDVLDDSVVPSLGALAAEYRQQKKPADSFFRGVTGILTGLSSEELTALKDLIAACDRFEETDDPRTVHVTSKRTIEIAESNIRWVEVGAASSHTEMLFRQLKAHGLGGETSSGQFGAESGPEFLSVQRDTVLRLVRILAD